MIDALPRVSFDVEVEELDDHRRCREYRLKSVPILDLVHDADPGFDLFAATAGQSSRRAIRLIWGSEFGWENLSVCGVALLRAISFSST